MSVSDTADPFSLVLIALMKGVTYREDDPVRWQALLDLQPRVRDYVLVLGLELILDEAEGHAFLRHHQVDDGEVAPPRLVRRHQFGFRVSLLLALLRGKLAEFDAAGADTRLVLDQGEIAELVRVFLPETANEVRLLDNIGSDINRIVDMGFLRQLKCRDDQYEVRRILKAFVDAQWLSESKQKLAQYRDHVIGTPEREEESA